jgi:transposase
MERIEQIYCNVSIILVYLPPYLPDLNPIEGFFAEWKAFIKQHWQISEDDPGQAFDTFLE